MNVLERIEENIERFKNGYGEVKLIKINCNTDDYAELLRLAKIGQSMEQIASDTENQPNQFCPVESCLAVKQLKQVAKNVYQRYIETHQQHVQEDCECETCLAMKEVKLAVGG